MKTKEVNPGNTTFIANKEAGEYLKAHVKTFPLPPEGFDPRKATDATLKYHGLHGRPDPTVHPLLAKRWDEIYSKKIRFVKPEFLFLRGTYYINPIPFWSGSVVETSATDPIWFVYGKFNVPDLSNSHVHFYYSGLVNTWLGIGGYKSQLSCRAGIQQMIVGAGNNEGGPSQTDMLFMQWGNEKLVIIPTKTFSVKPNDEISILLCVQGSPATSGYFNIVKENETETAQMVFQFVPPTGSEIFNESAEWIVARPDEIQTEGIPLQPVHYGQIEFDNSFAYTFGGNTLDSGTGKLLSYDADGVTSTATIAGPESVKLVSNK